MPPTISNVASEKRELGLQRKVQMRRISPFRELDRLELLMLLSANADTTKSQQSLKLNQRGYHFMLSPRARICAV